MNFTYNENAKKKNIVKTQPQPNNQLNIKLTQAEINIINKYKINNEEEFDLFKENILEDIDIVNINDIKINNNENEFIIYINNEKIIFTENTFDIILKNYGITIDNSNIINKDTHEYSMLDTHKNKNKIIEKLNENNDLVFNYNCQTYISNLYSNYMIIKTCYKSYINFMFILSKLNMYPTIYKIVETESYYYLIIKKVLPIEENKKYNIYNINNNTSSNIIIENKSPIYKNNSFMNILYKFFIILNNLNIIFTDDIINNSYYITNNNIYFTFLDNIIKYNNKPIYYYIKNNGDIAILDNLLYNIDKYKYNSIFFDDII